MSDSAPLRATVAEPVAPAAKEPVPHAESPAAGYGNRGRNTELEYQAILANASIGIAFTRERKFSLCNPKFEEMLGWGPGELIGRPGEVIYTSPESYAELGRIAVPVLREGRQLDLEWEFKRKDGSTLLCRVVAKAVNPSHTQAGTIWIAEDITERKRHSDELNRLLREQEAILGSASIGIVFVKDRHIVRCNRRYEEMYGYGPGEMDGKPTSILYADDETHREGDSAYTDLAQGRTFRRVQLRRHKDGSTFWTRTDGRAVDSRHPEKGSVWTVEDITEQRRAQDDLARLLAEQQALLDNVVVGIAFVRERIVQRCNQRFEELFGYPAGEGQGLPARALYFTDEEYAVRAATYPELDEGRSHQREQFLRRADGSGFWCRLSGRAVEPGNPAKGYVWLFEDVTLGRETEELVRRALAEQQLILDNATMGISFVKNRVYQRCNPRFEEMFGYPPGEMIGQSTAIIFPSKKDFEEAGDSRYEALARGERSTDERQLKRKDGTLIWCKIVGRAIDPARPHEGTIWIYDDISAEHAARQSLEQAVSQRTTQLAEANRKLEAEITERKQAEQRAQHLADHDALTGLPNRRLLEDRLTQALALSYRNREQTAVMFIDLDRFKTINDSLGHAVGDVLLKDVAKRLVTQLRDVDTICRIGGDEFVVVLPEIRRATDAAHVAQKVIEQLSLPTVVEGRELHVTPSIGISVFPEDGRDAETLIRNADAAMYHAKEMGRANYQFFTDQMNLSASRRLALENDLRRALQKGELRVHYQPIIELKGGCVAGHEALVRWQHPSRGLVPPAEFIQLAEDTGLILQIGEWVLREACRWATFIGVDRGLPVSVNLSARQFGDPTLVATVAQALKDSGLPANLLELEITESTAMQHTDVTAATIGKLKQLGVAIAIDDFGTGYSSLAYLKRFSVDRLKIDRSFVADIPGDKDHKAIVAAVVALSHALGLKVVAEGVETEAQMEFLQTCRCDYLQGFLAGAPVDADAAAKEYV
jgi:diguanylate cyclase (GGDEF)-like protein/PAS domain S-box-containing protein